MRLRSNFWNLVAITFLLFSLSIGCSEPESALLSSEPVVIETDSQVSEQAVPASHTTSVEAGRKEAPADPQNVPDGTPAELLKYIEQLAQPEPFETEEEMRKYMEPTSDAIVTAADRILKNDQATDAQLVDAIEWKVEAYRVKAELGDKAALAQADKFLVDLRSHPRAAIASQVDKIWMMNQLRQLPQQTSEQRAKTIRELAEFLNTTKLERIHVSVIIEIGDLLANSPDAPEAAKALKTLLPRIKQSDDPKVRDRAEFVEGLVRRLDLPGNKLELEGTFVDGSPLDWESYRGKVVLVDFWATDCIQCRAEIPNMLANYKDYHDKGFEILGISLDDDKAAVEAFEKRAGVPWPTLFNFEENKEGWDHPMAIRYAIVGIPQAILVDQEGKVVSMLARGPYLRRELQRLLGDPSPSKSGSAEKEESASMPRATENR